ncbi:oligopeptide/dipeptide ABC transporter, ATP-binding protein, C-terminal domain-containing protein [Nocardia amikacinitolerans]|uniref:Oligopeptide/dipeptide ABC transporter, ATP-binding protein, C-terminal domain-containing protein n=1 Tax=Nocardia amikacinitolerans TaxID=756689 RepID=A0A285L526_9NOCA|nr:oligopeptide/dipeptide ABC transporter, ATP-binding protein, C-terminal domain-containing protein [Nocardia amikacinitolerans]
MKRSLNGAARADEGGKSAATRTPRARVSDLHVVFRRRSVALHAVRGVSIEIAAGEILALVGESGSGKSVLGLSLLGLPVGDPPAVVTGRAEVCGVDMVTAPRAERRKIRRAHLGAVFQNPMTSLNPTMRIGDQVREVAGSTAAAVQLLDLVGVPQAGRRLRAYPHELSAGLRQRVMIAIAIAAEPDLIIADEPTSALDVTVQAQILALLSDLRAELGCSVLLITHDIGVAAEVADRVAVMYGGRLVEIGATTDVLAAPSHPYTVGLLGSRLDLGLPLGHRIPVLTGMPPDPRDPPPGCPFAPRCSLRTDECDRSLIPLTPAATHSGRAACILPAEVDRTHARGPTLAFPPLVIPVRSRPAVRCVEVGKGFRIRNRLGGREMLPVLRNLDLRVEAGEAVAVVGESGSGKSTLLRMMAGLEKPDSGVVEVSGSSTQMIFQDVSASLTPWLTVGRQVGERLPRTLDQASRRAQVIAALERVGLPAAVADLRADSLSTGQRQRVAFARATIVVPAVLLCDEPTSALDAPLAASTLNLIQTLRREFGLTVVFVTHDLAAARFIADRVAVMYRGEIVEIGAAEEVAFAPSHPYSKALLAAVPNPRSAPVQQRTKPTGATNVPSTAPDTTSGAGSESAAASVTPRRRAKPGDVITLCVLATLIVVMLGAPWIAPYDPDLPVGPPTSPPNAAHWLGTDEVGRDILSRVLIGMRSSWWGALGVIASGVALGGAVGLVAGALGGFVDRILMRVTDIFIALPAALLAIAVVAAIGPSYVHTLSAVALVWWPLYARVVRGEVTRLRSLPHIDAARLSGAGRLRLGWLHLLPGAWPPTIIAASLDVGALILMLSGLSFVGLGAPAPAPELGAMCSRGLPYLLDSWWVPIMPAIGLFVLATIANLAGDVLRDRLTDR